MEPSCDDTGLPTEYSIACATVLFICDVIYLIHLCGCFCGLLHIFMQGCWLLTCKSSSHLIRIRGRSHSSSHRFIRNYIQSKRTLQPLEYGEFALSLMEAATGRAEVLITSSSWADLLSEALINFPSPLASAFVPPSEFFDIL